MFKLPHSLRRTVDVGSELHIVLEVFKVVTHQLCNNAILFRQLVLQILDTTLSRVELLLQGLDPTQLFSLHDHHVVCVVYPVFSLTKVVSDGPHKCCTTIATYCHLNIRHGVVQTSTDNTHQLSTGVNDF